MKQTKVLSRKIMAKFKFLKDRFKRKSLNVHLIFCISIILFYVFITYYGYLTSPYEKSNYLLPTIILSYFDAVIKHNFTQYHQIGLWDNYSGLGTPIVLSEQFYPLNIISYIVPNLILGGRITMIFHIMLGGLAFFYLLKILKCENAGAAFGAVIYTVNFYVSSSLNIGHLPEIYNLVWMPLAVAFLWKALFDQKIKYALFCGVALAMHILAITLYSLYFTSIILLFLILFYFVYETIYLKKTTFFTVQRILTTVLLLSLITIGLSGVKLIPILEYSRYSMRENIPLYGSGSPYDLAWELATTKDVFYKVFRFTSPYGYNIAKLLVDSFLVLLLILALLKKSKEALFFYVISIISLWALMGKNAILDIYSLFYRIIPGMNTIEHPSRFTIILNLTLPVLASLGASYLIKRIQKTKLNKLRVSLNLIVISFVFIIYALFYYLIPRMSVTEHPFRLIIIFSLTLFLISLFGSNYLIHKIRIKKFNYLQVKISPVVFLLFFIILPCNIAYITWHSYNFFVLSTKNEYKIEIDTTNDNFNNEIGSLIQKEKDIIHVTSFYEIPAKQVTNYTGLIYNFQLTNINFPEFALNYQYFTLNYRLKLAKNTFSFFPEKEFQRKKYRLLSLMNSKYLVVQKNYDDYPNPYIMPVKIRNDGILYKLNSFQPYLREVPVSILLISSDDFNDFNAFKAKILLFQTEFDLSKSSIFTSTNNNINDYSLDELSKFDAVILSNPIIKNKDKASLLLERYRKNGGYILDLNFQKKYYQDIRYRNFSLMCNKPALSLDDRETKKFADLIDILYQNKHTLTSRINLVRYTPELIDVNIQTSGKNTFFQIAQTYYPGWKLYIDGIESKIYMADGLVKGFVIPERSNHLVKLIYDPLSFKVGLFVSILTLISLLTYLRYKKYS